MATTWDELVARLGPDQMAHIQANADTAPPLPAEALETLTAVFAGAGERVLAARGLNAAA